MNRLGIFFICDNENIIDDSTVFLLEEIKKFLTHLTIVSKNELSPESHEVLKKITDDIVVGANADTVFTNPEKFLAYDELIMFDNSFYGFFYSFDKIFSAMDKNYPDADFWGITIQGDEFGIPEHLQEYFLVFRKKIFHSEDFYLYWKNPRENFLTKTFADKDYKYAAYCDTRNFEKNYDSHADYSLICPERLLKFYDCPILKKEIFKIPRVQYLKESYGEEPRKCLEFVKNFTDYDVNLIWKNILRENNIATIKSNLALNYILSSEKTISNSRDTFKKVAVIAHLYYEDLMADYVKYLVDLPKEISVVITVDSEKKKNLLEELFSGSRRKCEIRIVAGRGRDIAALLVGCADIFQKFKYLCFVHDKKSFRANESAIIGKTFSDILWDNVLDNAVFVKNIISVFENEPRLGLLLPPQPYHGMYQNLFFAANFWSKSCFEKIVALAEELGISKKFFDIKIAPLAIGTVFWCRTESLKKITAKTWRVEDFPQEPLPDDGTINHALERIFPFAAQELGYYTGCLLTEKFARADIENFMCLSKYYYRLQKKFQTLHATIFFDEHGKNFIEQIISVEESGNFHAKFFYNAVKPINYLRFDPDENFISIKLEKFKVNGASYNFRANDAEYVEDFYNFMTSDPQFIFDVKNLQGGLNIEISGTIKFDYLRSVNEKIISMRDEKILFEENHKQEIALLEENIKKLKLKLAEQKKLNDNILNSTSWKVTAQLRKISKIIR